MLRPFSAPSIMASNPFITTDSDESCNCRKFSPFLDTKRIGNTYERTYGIWISLWILCSSMFVYLAVASSIHSTVKKSSIYSTVKKAAWTNHATVGRGNQSGGSDIHSDYSGTQTGKSPPGRAGKRENP